MNNIAIIGSGAWGTALAIHASNMGHRVSMWAFEPEVIADINDLHVNTIYLPGIPIPNNVQASEDIKLVVKNADLVILAPPSRHLRSILQMLAGAIPDYSLVLLASKGIEASSLKLMSEVVDEVYPEFGSDRLAFLSGPSFAKEVGEGLSTDLVVASKNMKAAHKIQPILHAPAFRIYTSGDPIGVQIGGALKNVIAVAAGASDGMRLGSNARAALITRGLAEITRLGVACGANALTFLGMAGIGDLVLTCTGELSRNRTLGLKLAEGEDPKSFLASQRAVAEGFHTAAAAYHLAQKLTIDMPITEQVYHVLHHGRTLSEAIRLLMNRKFKDELTGIEC